MASLKKYPFIITLASTQILFAISCSSSRYQNPESIEERMISYEAKEAQVHPVPALAVMEYRPTTLHRAPASVKDTHLIKKNKSFSSYSNKRIYFLTLLKQYNEMKNYTSGVAPEIKVCPAFHTSWWDEQKSDKSASAENKLNSIFKDVASIKTDVITKSEVASMYPELYLPLTADDNYPTVLDIVKKDNTVELEGLLANAYQIHIQKTYAELAELCEYGQSANYYIFENLITHIKTKGPLGQSTEGLKTLVKTTLVSNMTLITSLKARGIESGITLRGRAPASVASIDSMNSAEYEDEALDRLQALWSKDYLGQIKNKRR